MFAPSVVTLLTGDLAYALGSSLTWEIFGSFIEPVSQRIPYMVAIGNHGLDVAFACLCYDYSMKEYDHTSGGQNDPSGAPGEGFHPSWGDYGFEAKNTEQIFLTNASVTTAMANVLCQSTTDSTCRTMDCTCSGLQCLPTSQFTR